MTKLELKNAAASSPPTVTVLTTNAVNCFKIAATRALQVKVDPLISDLMA